MRGALTDSPRVLNPKCVSKALGRKFNPFPVIRDIVQSELSEQLTEARRRSERVGHNAFEVIHGYDIGSSVGRNLAASDQSSRSSHSPTRDWMGSTDPELHPPWVANERS